MTTSSRGYVATKDQLRGRPRRIEGQVRGIARMVDEDRSCTEVLTQISAVRAALEAVQAALEKVALSLLYGHARHCMRRGAAEGRADELTDEMMAAVGRLIKHG